MKVFRTVNYNSQRIAEFASFDAAKNYCMQQMEEHGFDNGSISVYEYTRENKYTPFVGSYNIDDNGNINGMCIEPKGKRWELRIIEDVIDEIFNYHHLHDLISSTQYLTNLYNGSECVLRHVAGANTEHYKVVITEDGLMFSNLDNFRHF